MRSLGRALIQYDWCYDWCPYKREKFGYRDRHSQKEDNVKTHAGSRWTHEWSDAFKSQEGPRISGKHQELGEAEKGPPLEALEGERPCRHSDLDSALQSVG